VDRVNKERCVEVEGGEEISMWLLYSADPRHNGANKVVGKFTVHKLASDNEQGKEEDLGGGGAALTPIRLPINEYTYHRK